MCENKIFVHNLTFDTDEAALRAFFQQGANIDPVSVSILLNPKHGKPSGSAFCTFANSAEVEAAVSLDSVECGGRKAFISEDTDNRKLLSFCQRIGVHYTVKESGGLPELTLSRSQRNENPGYNNSNSTDSRATRRLFVHNLSFSVDWQTLKQFFVDNGLEKPFVEMLVNPKMNKPAGAAIVEFRSADLVATAKELDGQEFEGRKIWINQDPDNFHVKKFCDRNGITFYTDAKSGRPVLIEHGAQPPSQGGNNQMNGHQNQFNNMGMQPPAASFGGSDPHGNPLVNDISDLLKTSVFISNLPFTIKENDIENLFARCGKISRIQMLVHGDNADESKRGKFRGMATLEYLRARDATRACMQFEGYSFNGRNINCRMAKENRELPEGLDALARPHPESHCMQLCQTEYRIDPYNFCSLFVSNLSYDVTEEQVREVFSLVGDVKRALILTEKGEKGGRSRGIAIVKMATGIDALQAINVLNDARINNREIKVRFDREKNEVAGTPPAYGTPNMNQNMGFQAQPAMPAAPANPGFYGNTAAPAQPMNNFAYGAPANPPPMCPPANDDNTVKQLAAVLGVDANALAALRDQNKAPAGPPAQMMTQPQQNMNNGWANQQQRSNVRERSPIRNGRAGIKTGYQANKPNSQPPAQAPAATITADKAWTPVTKDTVYIRNIPPTMDENRLRSLMHQCGTITFLDFPKNPNGSPVGYAYVRFAGDLEKAISRAIGCYDNFSVEGNKLEVGQY